MRRRVERGKKKRKIGKKSLTNIYGSISENKILRDNIFFFCANSCFAAILVTEAYKKVVLMIHTYKNIFVQNQLNGKYPKVKNISVDVKCIVFYWFLHTQEETEVLY